ncbi:MAG: hypothetical protein LW709_11415 [Oxalobacteraceae bacterium]|nr:hypothetical protein [Oxalobacteraceae bacterium]
MGAAAVLGLALVLEQKIIARFAIAGSISGNYPNPFKARVSCIFVAMSIAYVIPAAELFASKQKSLVSSCAPACFAEL